MAENMKKNTIKKRKRKNKNRVYTHNTKKLSPEELMKYRETINDENYLNNAINDMAYYFTKGLQITEGN